MGQPTPNDMPLFEGVPAEWNDIVSAIPEDKRSELGPILRDRVNQYEPLKGWSDLHKSGITPEFAKQGVDLWATIENNPRTVYDTLARHLNITPEQAKEVVEEIEDADQDDPRIKAMQEQINTLAQLTVAKEQQTRQEKMQAEQEAALDKDLNDLKKKYGDVDEEEIVMRMLQRDMTAEEAYQSYAEKVNGLLKRRPSPMVMGAGGVIPRNAIDVTKLDNAGTKNLVAQMLQQANNER